MHESLIFLNGNVIKIYQLYISDSMESDNLVHTHARTHIYLYDSRFEFQRVNRLINITEASDQDESVVGRF